MASILPLFTTRGETMQHTNHARDRMRRRGVRQAFLDLLVASADLDSDVGGGAALYRVSRQAAQTQASCDKLGRFGAIVSDDCALITVLPLQRQRPRNRYRVGWSTRSSDARRARTRRAGGRR